MANGMISVHRGHRQDIGTEIQTEWLSEFDQFAENCTTLKSERYVPGELRQNVEQTRQQIGHA